MNDELLDELYKFEWELRDGLTSTVNIPILGITLVGGLITTVALDFHFEPNWIGSAVAAALILTALSLCTATWFVASSLLIKAYLALPQAGKMAKHYEQLLAWHRTNGTSDPESAAKLDFSAGLREERIEAIDRNSTVNRARADNIRFAIIFVVASLAFSGIAAGGYLSLRMNAPDPVHRVAIVGSKCVNP